MNRQQHKMKNEMKNIAAPTARCSIPSLLSSPTMSSGISKETNLPSPILTTPTTATASANLSNSSSLNNNNPIELVIKNDKTVNKLENNDIQQFIHTTKTTNISVINNNNKEIKVNYENNSTETSIDLKLDDLQLNKLQQPTNSIMKQSTVIDQLKLPLLGSNSLVTTTPTTLTPSLSFQRSTNKNNVSFFDKNNNNNKCSTSKKVNFNFDSNLWTKKSKFENKESYHLIEKTILYNMNPFLIPNTQNLANYLEKMTNRKT
jgi:hypothetical protein